MFHHFFKRRKVQYEIQMWTSSDQAEYGEIEFFRKFDYSWLSSCEFSAPYIVRFLKEYDLVWCSKKSDQTNIPENYMDIHRLVIWNYEI